MSRVKGLKGDPNINMNLFDLFSVFSFEGKSKYTELFVRILKNTKGLGIFAGESRRVMSEKLEIDRKTFDQLNDFQVIVLSLFVNELMTVDSIKDFIKFGEYNERKLVKNNDLQKITSFEQISEEINRIEISVQSAEMQKQTKVLFNDEDWIILRPGTIEASMKYGSNTQWCTTMRDSSQFDNYTTNGVLVYCINKKTNYKVAVFRSLTKNYEYSFWDQIDTRVDSMQTDLTEELKRIIHDECFHPDVKSNRDLFGFNKKPKMMIGQVLGGQGMLQQATQVIQPRREVLVNQHDDTIDISFNQNVNDFFNTPIMVQPTEQEIDAIGRMMGGSSQSIQTHGELVHQEIYDRIVDANNTIQEGGLPSGEINSLLGTNTVSHIVVEFFNKEVEDFSDEHRDEEDGDESELLSPRH